MEYSTVQYKLQTHLHLVAEGFERYFGKVLIAFGHLKCSLNNDMLNVGII